MLADRHIYGQNQHMRNSESRTLKSYSAVAVDLFCGAGGLTHGMLRSGISVAAGYDIDGSCRYPYEHNNKPARFVLKSVTEMTKKDLAGHYPAGAVKILTGCAPCQTFSKYTQGSNNENDPKWTLLREFGRLVIELQPDIVSMENVPQLQEFPIFDNFLCILKGEGFHFTKIPEERIIYCPDYGMAQRRYRLVVVASRIGSISLIPKTHSSSQYKTVRDVLSKLSKLDAGGVSEHDSLHRCSRLSDTNLKRIRISTPGGSWRDWPTELIADCHKKKSGKTYPSVYGRMKWDDPSPTMTTQFYGFGNGRFGHPEQDRAISLREGAILQSFPKSYQFVRPGDPYSFKRVGRLIGNAVPVRLGEIVGRSIQKHLKAHFKGAPCGF
jgi:DNA (cytosine-5)-methyltransferase 1